MEGVLSLCLILTETACCQGSLCLQCSGLRKPLPHLGLFFRALSSVFYHRCMLRFPSVWWGWTHFPPIFFFFLLCFVTRCLLRCQILSAFGETCLSTQVSHTSGFYLLIFCFKFFFPLLMRKFGRCVFPFSNCFYLIEEKSGFLNSQLISLPHFLRGFL